MKKIRSQIGLGLFDQPESGSSGISPRYVAGAYNIYGWNQDDFLKADIFILGEWRPLLFRLISYGNGDECWEADFGCKAIFFHLLNNQVTVEVDE